MVKDDLLILHFYHACNTNLESTSSLLCKLPIVKIFPKAAVQTKNATLKYFPKMTFGYIIMIYAKIKSE